VQANACSIGFAARTAVDASVLHANLGARLDGVSASTANVQNLLSSQSPVYPMARTLWVNSIDPNSLSGDEFMLLQQGFQTPSVIDPIMQNRNFAPVPAGVARSYSCPSGLPNPLAGP
jgi:hypothetical protein